MGEHEAVALIGASGSGKSTLLRCIDLLEEIDDGDIFLDGEPITVPGQNPVPIRRRLGPGVPVLQPVPAHARDRQRHARRRARPEDPGRGRRAQDGLSLLARFGLEDRAREYPDKLSGGQQQRVAIARAMLTRPRALLLDEVTSALDPELVGEVLELIRELKLEGMTMILATHEMSFARDVADQVCFLEDGRIVEQGPPEQVLSAPREAATQRFLARLISADRL